MPIDKHILPIVQVCYLSLALVPFILILSSASRALILTVIRKITRTWPSIREEGTWEGGNYKSCSEKKGLRVVKDYFWLKRGCYIKAKFDREEK